MNIIGRSPGTPLEVFICGPRHQIGAGWVETAGADGRQAGRRMRPITKAQDHGGAISRSGDRRLARRVRPGAALDALADRRSTLELCSYPENYGERGRLRQAVQP